MQKIYYGRQQIDQKDINFVSKALKNNLITSGSLVSKFENRISKYLKVKNTVVCNSGTSAIHLAFDAINLKKNDVIIMPAINFISSYNMAKLYNAKIYLCDVNPYTGLVTPETILDCIKKYKIRKIKCILTMHLGGIIEHPEEFFHLKKKYKCFLIEDACHAFGTTYKVKNKKYMVGSCKHSDIACFSFHPIKTITTGEGGAITTNNKNFYQRSIKFRSHNIKKINFQSYNIDRLGFKYRLSDINCALGISQLSKIKKFLLKRSKIRNYYKKNLFSLKSKVKIIENSKLSQNSNHLLIVQLTDYKAKKKLTKFFSSNNIFVQYHYIPIYRFKFINSYLIKNYPGCEYYYQRSLSIPNHVMLKKKELNKVINLFFKFFKKSK